MILKTILCGEILVLAYNFNSTVSETINGKALYEHIQLTKMLGTHLLSQSYWDHTKSKNISSLSI